MKNHDSANEEEKQKAQLHKSLLRLKGKPNLQIDLSIPRDRQDQLKK
jgi:hypothetical protein